MLSYPVAWIDDWPKHTRDRAIIDTPFGRLIVQTVGHVVVGIEWSDDAPLRAPENPALAQIVTAILSGWQVDADTAHGVTRIPLAVQGTPFQQRVWRALRDIPCGEVMSYHALAIKLHSSARAIGQACRTNPYPLIVPCHRIVAARGLGGYCGATQGVQRQRKQRLLDFERTHPRAAM